MVPDEPGRTVLVPLDGSPLAEAIIPHVLRMAPPLRLETTLLRVLAAVPPTATGGSPRLVLEATERLHQEAEDYLRTIARQLAEQGVRAVPMVRVGDPATEIVAVAREFDVELIAMTTHGRGGLGRLVFGSAADAVLRRVEIPVFLLRATEAKRARRAA